MERAGVQYKDQEERENKRDTRARNKKRERDRGPNTKDLDRQVVIYCLATDSSVVSLSLN